MKCETRSTVVCLQVHEQTSSKFYFSSAASSLEKPWTQWTKYLRKKKNAHCIILSGLANTRKGSWEYKKLAKLLIIRKKLLTAEDTERYGKLP